MSYNTLKGKKDCLLHSATSAQLLVILLIIQQTSTDPPPPSTHTHKHNSVQNIWYRSGGTKKQHSPTRTHFSIYLSLFRCLQGKPLFHIPGGRERKKSIKETRECPFSLYKLRLSVSMCVSVMCMFSVKPGHCKQL